MSLHFLPDKRRIAEPITSDCELKITKSEKLLSQDVKRIVSWPDVFSTLFGKVRVTLGYVAENSLKEPGLRLVPVRLCT